MRGWAVLEIRKGQLKPKRAQLAPKRIRSLLAGAPALVVPAEVLPTECRSRSHLGCEPRLMNQGLEGEGPALPILARGRHSSLLSRSCRIGVTHARRTARSPLLLYCFISSKLIVIFVMPTVLIHVFEEGPELNLILLSQNGLFELADVVRAIILPPVGVPELEDCFLVIVVDF